MATAMKKEEETGEGQVEEEGVTKTDLTGDEGVNKTDEKTEETGEEGAKKSEEQTEETGEEDVKKTEETEEEGVKKIEEQTEETDTEEEGVKQTEETGEEKEDVRKSLTPETRLRLASLLCAELYKLGVLDKKGSSPDAVKEFCIAMELVAANRENSTLESFSFRFAALLLGVYVDKTRNEDSLFRRECLKCIEEITEGSEDGGGSSCTSTSTTSTTGEESTTTSVSGSPSNTESTS